MDFGLLEYALWVALGLWSALFTPYAITRGAGLVLIILALLRALTEADAAGGRDRSSGRRERATTGEGGTDSRWRGGQAPGASGDEAPRAIGDEAPLGDPGAAGWARTERADLETWPVSPPGAEGPGPGSAPPDRGRPAGRRRRPVL